MTLRQVITALIWFFALCVLGYVLTHAECKSDPVKGYACNWTQEQMDVMIVPHDGNKSKRAYVFTLEPESSMGKPYCYNTTHPPNVYKLELPCGMYDVKWKYAKDTVWKSREVKICHKMRQPFELDFEPDVSD